MGVLQVQKRGREASEVEVVTWIEHGARFVYENLDAELQVVSYTMRVYVVFS